MGPATRTPGTQSGWDSVAYTAGIIACGKAYSMITPIDLHRDLAKLPLLKERDGHPTDAESLKSFATLVAYRDGGIFATHFRGSSHGAQSEVDTFDVLLDAIK